MAKATPRTELDLSVTENEGAVLSLIGRTQPVTRYRLFKSFQQSPTTSSNTSKGTLYPLIGRIIGRGFVVSDVASTGRSSEELRLTDRGRKALGQWMMETRPEHSFGDDPLLVRILSLGDMSSDDRVRWIADAKALLLAKKQELIDYRATVDGPYVDIVHGSAVAMVNAKLEWLDRLLIEVVRR